MLLATQTQAVYGQGTHTFAADLAELKKLRSSIMRSVWNTDCYSMSPYVTFALLLPPQLDPLFGHIYHGLRTLARCVRNPSFAATSRRRLAYCSGTERDGPTVRLWHVQRVPVYAPFIAALFGEASLDEERWAHELRAAWRQHLWELVAKERPQHYRDAIDIDYGRTMSFYNKLRAQAAITQVNGIEALEYDGPIGDARAQLSILRRLFAGGMLTDERVARHRREAGQRLCSCGAEQTVLHVSWDCPLYQDDRREFLEETGLNGHNLPMCTQYAALVPASLDMPILHVEMMQRMLTQIWQKHIRAWHEGLRTEAELLRLNDDDPDNGAGPHEYTSNGHLLTPRVGNPGVYCKKCGRYVARLKHIRLKITGKPCSQKDAPRTRWAEQEGWSMSTARLDAAERELHQVHNRGNHTLAWNRRVGKIIDSPDEGLITCLRCNKQWRWKDRRSILSKIVCSGPPFRPKYRLQRKTHPRNVQTRSDDSAVALPDVPAAPREGIG